MYARRQTRPKPRKSQMKKWPAPVAGWIANRALSTPESIEGPGAAVLDNMFPTTTSVRLRRGQLRYATLLEESLPVTSLFSYSNGPVEKLFAANSLSIYDVTQVDYPEPVVITDHDGNRIVTENGDWFGWNPTEDLIVQTGNGSGEWITTQFATTGGVYLIGVNGQDDGFIYDGTEFWPNIAGGLWYIPLRSETTPFVNGEVVTGGTSGATATVFRDNQIEMEWSLDYDGGMVSFAPGETVTGGTSGATAIIKNLTGNAISGTLVLTDLVGSFLDDEAITGSIVGQAIANGSETILVGSQLVVHGDIVETEMEWTLAYDGGTVDFTVGETITGAASGAEAVVANVTGTTSSGTLTLNSLIGNFVNGEDITGDQGGDADADGTEVFVIGGPFQAGETLTGSISGDAVADAPQANAVPGMDFGDLTSADMAAVWVYKNRLFFAERDTMNAWYLDVDSVGGEATRFPLSGVFTEGGSLLFGSSWSLDSTGDAGLSQQCVFVSTKGQVAVYQGDNPNEASDWAQNGLYRVGTPLGRRAYMRGGGDLLIATSVGLVPLSRAISLDVTALNVATVSYKIADAWSGAVATGSDNWKCEIWPEGKMAFTAPPFPTNPAVFVSNTETGAWCRFTGLLMLSMEDFQGNMYFGTTDGRIFLSNTQGSDDGTPYTGVVTPLFDDLGSPGSLKITTVGRAKTRSNAEIADRLDVVVDFDMTPPPAPDAVVAESSSVWGGGVWGTSTWGDITIGSIINQDWQSVGEAGYNLSLCYQVTSNSLTPLDVEVIDFEVMFDTAEVVT